MPELPEVEVTRLGLLPKLPGRKVVKITCSGKKLRTPVPKKLLSEHLVGNSIKTVERRAKYLLFRISNNSTMVIHLGMTGKLSIIAPTVPHAKHDHLWLLLDDGMELRFNDTRRFGSVIFWPPGEEAELEKIFSSRLGVEPFSDSFSIPYLQKQSRSRTMPIKNFLMDSRIIAGIGNIYANEILFAASLNPQQPAKSLGRKKWATVIASTRSILTKAIQAGGSTISDFLGTSGNPGYFQVHFNVYNRGNAPCNKCNASISKLQLGGRATYFCPSCQPLKTD